MISVPFLLILFVSCSHLSHGLTATRRVHLLPTPKDRRSPTLLRARPFLEDDNHKPSAERPTMTKPERMGPKLSPPKPKIVVLGASGRIGRLVVRQCLDMNMEATIVAFVRDYDKACRVLYEDVMFAKTKKGQPTLEIVQGNLVPMEDMPFQESEEEDEDDYDEDIQTKLEQAIQGCTAIISCVGSVRPTHIFSDWPLWRLFRKDVSRWCRDRRHPFYVHYVSTRKVVGLAEREQLKRQAAVSDEDEEDEEPPPRIRFIRISDLCVAHPPWRFVPLLTNALQSMVFRYQDMTERLLEESTLLDTIILRPGDLVDDERDRSTTNLQVDASGRVPSPAVVGREDVASLAVSSALWKLPKNTTKTHCTLGVRWVGTDILHYPPQGRKEDGWSDASVCLEKISPRKRNRRNRFHRYPKLNNLPVLGKRRTLKPYGVWVAVLVYSFMGLFLRSLSRSLSPLVSHLPPPILLAIQRLAVLWTSLCGTAASYAKRRFLDWIPPLLMKQNNQYFSF